MLGRNALVRFCAGGVLVSLSMGPALSAWAPGAARQVPPPSASGTSQVPAPEAVERALFEAVNQERAARDLPALRLSSPLCDVARKHSQEMARLGRLAHESAAGGSIKERLDRARIACALSAENVARGATSDPALIHEALMKSEGHRENILLVGVDEIGVGVVRGPDGDFYVTQDFIRSVTWLDEKDACAAVLGVLDAARRSRGLEPLAVFDEISRTAQAFARLKAEGRDLPPVPPEFGSVRVDFFAGVEMEAIAAKVRGLALESFGMAGIGVFIGPTAAHPAGAYQVCTFLLEGHPAVHWDEPRRVRAVLGAVNEVRARKRAGPVALDDGLSREAGRLLERYLQSRSEGGDPRSPSLLARLAGLPSVGTVVVFYETSDLDLLAPSLHARIEGRGIRKIGISVRPTTPGLAFTFVVVLVLGD